MSDERILAAYGVPPPMVGPEFWYLALCHDCEPVLEQPFDNPRDRAQWVVVHRGIGHRVTVHDVRKGRS